MPQPGLVSEAERAFWSARAAPKLAAPPSACANASFEIGIDYAGADLKTTDAPTPEACCALCGAHKGCTAWTHRAAGAGYKTACWLKSSAKGRHCLSAHTSGQPGVAKPPPHHCTPGPPPPHGPPSPPGPPPPPHKWGSPPQLWNTLHVDGVRQVRARFPNGNPQENSGKCFSATGGLSSTGEGCDGWLSIQGKAGSLPRSTPGYSFKSALDRNKAPTVGGPTSDGGSYGTFKYTIYDPPAGHPVYNKPMPDWSWRNNSVFSFWNDLLSHAPGGVGYKNDINKTYANAGASLGPSLLSRLAPVLLLACIQWAHSARVIKMREEIGRGFLCVCRHCRCPHVSRRAVGRVSRIQTQPPDWTHVGLSDCTGLSAADSSGLWVVCFSWSFQVADQDTATNALLFSHGGYQEARGAGGGKHYYVENVLEELDTPGVRAVLTTLSSHVPLVCSDGAVAVMARNGSTTRRPRSFTSGQTRPTAARARRSSRLCSQRSSESRAQRTSRLTGLRSLKPGRRTWSRCELDSQT